MPQNSIRTDPAGNQFSNGGERITLRADGNGGFLVTVVRGIPDQVALSLEISTVLAPPGAARVFVRGPVRAG